MPTASASSQGVLGAGYDAKFGRFTYDGSKGNVLVIRQGGELDFERPGQLFVNVEPNDTERFDPGIEQNP